MIKTPKWLANHHTASIKGNGIDGKTEYNVGKNCHVHPQKRSSETRPNTLGTKLSRGSTQKALHSEQGQRGAAAHRGRPTSPRETSDLRPRRPRADPALPGWRSSGHGARVPAASPAGELEGEEQGAAKRHGPAQQLRPPARHERGAAQPAAQPALRGRRRPGRAEGAGALGAAAATLVLGVVAAAAPAAAAASAFRHYMLPVAGFIPPLPPPRARGPGPARRSRTSQAAAPANPDPPRQRHFRGAPPTTPESAQMHAPPESHAPWDHAPAPTESARLLAALAAASSFHRSLPSCTDCAVCSHSRSAPPPILRLRRRCTLVPDASWRCVLAGPSVRQLFGVLLGFYSSLPQVSEP